MVITPSYFRNSAGNPVTGNTNTFPFSPRNPSPITGWEKWPCGPLRSFKIECVLHQEIECMCAKTTQIPENNTFNTITQYPRLLTREGKIRCMRGTKSTRNNLIRNNLIHKVQCCQNKTYVYQFTLYLVFWETLNFMNGPSSNEKLKINLILYFLAIFLTKICHLPLVWPKAKNEISSYISHLIILMTRFLYVSHARMYGVSTFQLPMPVNHKLSNTNI